MKKALLIIFIVAALFLAYGYICREANIYFFWESRNVGFLFLFIGLFLALLRSLKSRRRQNKKITWVMIGIILFTVGFIGGSIAFIIVRNSEVYSVATNYLKHDSAMNNEVGLVTGFGFFPSGQVKTVNYDGEATFSIIVQGTKKFKDVNIHLTKQNNSDWEVRWVR
jgi:Cytochrome oxidase complex assembly protein 1